MPRLEYNTTYNDSQTYIHIPSTHIIPRGKCNPSPHHIISRAKCTCGSPTCHADPEDIAHSYREELARFRNMTEYRAKIQPVSVIVSDKSQPGSGSVSGSASPASSHENEVSGTDDPMNRHMDAETGKTGSTSINGDGTTGPKKSKCEYTYKPVPMVRKSRRRFISAEQKDESYWERRRRNNEAAKKSREQRREKEIEVNRKCTELEKENSGLKFTVINLQERNKQMETTIHMYKELLYKNNLL